MAKYEIILKFETVVTVKGRFPTHKDSRKWFVISPTEKKYEKD